MKDKIYNFVYLPKTCKHTIEYQLDLEIFRTYFKMQGQFNICIGCKDVENTKELHIAYIDTLQFLERKQKEILESILNVAVKEYQKFWRDNKFLYLGEEEYDETKRYFEHLTNKKYINNVVEMGRVYIIPLIQNGLCYIAVCLKDIKKTYIIPTLWIIMEHDKIIYSTFDFEEKMNVEEPFYRHMKVYQAKGKYPELEEPIEKKLDIPKNLGRENNLAKFRKIAPYLINMDFYVATKSIRNDYFLPRRAYPIGEYNGVVFFFHKLLDLKWEDCPVFYADIELKECVPLAENLVSFLKLATITQSFMKITGAIGLSSKEYENYLTSKNSDVSQEIKAINENFNLPEIDNVYIYVNQLQKNAKYVNFGKDMLLTIYKKMKMKNNSLVR